MIQSFKDKGTEDIFNGKNSKDARKTFPQLLWKIATRELDQPDSVKHLMELRVTPNNELEALARERKGQYGIRINDQYRICFTWQGLVTKKVEITDYH